MKKIIVTLLTLALTLSSLPLLSSCGDNGEDEGHDSGDVGGENDGGETGGENDGEIGGETGGETGDENDGGETEEEEEEVNTPDFKYNTTTGKFEISYDKGESWITIGSCGYADGENIGTPYPTENIEKLPGTIADASNKYIIANSDAGGWHGGIIDLAGMNYKFVRLERNISGNDLGYAFLTAKPTKDAAPKYATGYSYCVWDSSRSVTLEIPSDAKYLYVYYNSEGDVHLPSSVTFLDSYTDPLKSDKDEYIYPLHAIELLDGFVNGSNVYKASTLNVGAIVELGGTTFNTVTLRKNPNAASLTYAFMGDEFFDGFTPCYAAGYTNIVTSTDDTVTLRIPDNARYLYVYYKKGADLLLPAEIKLTKQSYGPTNPNSVRIATWNIGHFAMGEKANSQIKDEQVAMKSADFLDYINNAINADIMFLNEYSAKFTKNTYLAKNTIFKDYTAAAYEGPQLNYSCNAVYSRIEISEPQKHEFECNKTAPYISPYVEAKDYYFVTTDLVIGGKIVKLVSVHLAFDDYGSKNVLVNQLNELIEYCAQYEHVVMLGDWNVGSFSEFDVLVEAGYTLGNTDKNMPTYKSGSSLDNIVYKGVTVTDFSLGGTNLSDHYALYCTITVED